MANKLSSKTKNFANNRSHANNRSNRVQNLNYQKFTINGVKVKTTAAEARTFKKNNAIKEDVVTKSVVTEETAEETE